MPVCSCRYAFVSIFFVPLAGKVYGDIGSRLEIEFCNRKTKDVPQNHERRRMAFPQQRDAFQVSTTIYLMVGSREVSEVDHWSGFAPSCASPRHWCGQKEGEITDVVWKKVLLWEAFHRFGRHTHCCFGKFYRVPKQLLGL